MAQLPPFLAAARETLRTQDPTSVAIEDLESLRQTLLERFGEERARFLRLPLKSAANKELALGLERVTARLTRSYQLVIGGKASDPALWPQLDALRYAIEEEGKALAYALEGKREQALDKNREAISKASSARAGLSQGSHLGQKLVYDRLTGRSRYDAEESPEITYPLRCPKESCGEPGDYLLSPLASTRQLRCHSCDSPMTAYVGSVEERSSSSSTRGVEYKIQCSDLDGTRRELRFEAALSGDPMTLAPNDLLVVIYDEDHRLCIVRNITRGGEVWVSPGSRCFVATAATGPFSPEVRALRAFRERRLRPHLVGRLAIQGYEGCAPFLAAWIHAHPTRRRLVRLALRRLARRLEPSFFDPPNQDTHA